jgi:hypothetical protein
LGQLIAIEEHDSVIDAICGLFRAELSGFAARVTGFLPLTIAGVLFRLAHPSSTALKSDRPALALVDEYNECWPTFDSPSRSATMP